MFNLIPLIRRIVFHDDAVNEEEQPAADVSPPIGEPLSPENYQPGGSTLEGREESSLNENPGGELQPGNLRPSTEPYNYEPSGGMEYYEPPVLQDCSSPRPQINIENELAKILMRIAFMPLFMHNGARCTWKTVQSAVNSMLSDMFFDVSQFLLSEKLIHFNTFHHRQINSRLHEFLNEIKFRGYGSWNLSVFKPEDVNVSLIPILPQNITDTLLPINVDDGPLNFYNSFCMAYLVCRDGGEVFRRAVAHRVITFPDEFNAISDILREEKHRVLSNLRFAGPPTETEIAILSKLIEKNITIFTFDENGRLISDISYNFSPVESEGTKTVFLGCYVSENGRKYFPLIRKKYRTCNPPEATMSAVLHNAGRNIAHNE